MSDRQIQRGKQWLEKLLSLMGMPAGVKTSQTEGEQELGEASLWLIIDETNITPQNIDILIGQKGEGIDAIQYLANTLLNLGTQTEEQRSFTVELNGYRVRRQAELQALVDHNT